MSKSTRSIYTVDPIARYVYAKWTGLLDVASLLDDLREISAGFGSSSGYDELLDLREIRFVASETELRGLALNFAAMRPLIGSWRTAWVVDDDLSFGMIRVLIALNRDDRHSMNIFRSLELARRWLSLDDERKRPSTPNPTPIEESHASTTGRRPPAR